MVFSPTSSANRRRTGAFSLVELMFSVSIGMVVLAAGVMFWAYASRTTAQLSNYVDLTRKSKWALDYVSQQVRDATNVQVSANNRLVLNLLNGDKIDLTYDSNGRQLTSAKGIRKKVLLTDCDSFQFFIYQRTPTSNSYNLVTSAYTNSTTKVVQLDWVCSRKLTGDKKAAETQMSAKIIMRNL